MINTLTWIIIGASSPIARAFSNEVAKQKCKLILAGRDLQDIQNTASDIQIRTHVKTEVLFLDVNQIAAHQTFINQCKNIASGKINIFIAAGCMFDQSNIENDINLLLLNINSNYSSIAALLTQFIPVFEKQNEGSIVVLGSVAGDRGRPKNYAYGSSKAAIHIFLQGLRARLHRYNVKIITVKPGFIDTSMTYGKQNIFLKYSPDKCAKSIISAIRKNRNICYIPRAWYFIMLLIKLIPEKIFKKMDF